MMHIIKPALTLLLIAAISTGTLAFVNDKTKEPIESQRKAAQERTLRAVFPQASDFRERAAQASGSIVTVFEALSAGNIVGYVVMLAPDGYSGKIHMMAGISEAEQKITGMRIMRHTETPGLGALATKENFYRRFDNKQLVPLRVVKTPDGTSDSIDAITASTITTRAVTAAVNEAIEWYNGGKR